MAQRQFRSDDTDPWVLGFGDGSDGDLTISSNTTEAPIDASCSGTSGTTSLSATNASFATGQLILIHQTRGTGAGNWELNKIAGYTAGTITTSYALQNTYTDSGASQAQVRVMKQYNNVTINSGQTWTAKAWNGDVGGILAFFAKGTVTVTGTITSSGKGYRGGTGAGSQGQAQAGEGSSGAATAQRTANGNGGGGGQGDDVQGGGGGNGTAGSNGYARGNYGLGGSAVGNASLTSMFFGGASGAGSNYDAGAGLSGVPGGGIILIIGSAISITGSITSTGTSGTQSSEGNGSAAGGSTLLKCKTATLGTNLITALGGPAIGAWPSNGSNLGAAGGVGRIHIDYKTSYTGTTNPTLDATQDATLDYISGGASFLFNLA